MFSLFERLLQPTTLPPDKPAPRTLVAFYWHFIKQVGWLLPALFATGLIVAALDTLIPVFIGHVVTMVSRHAPGALLQDAWPVLLGMACFMLLLRPAALLAQNVVTNQALAPGLNNLIRWQNHWHVVRQSWTFFQNDFAGRIASRVMQTGPSIRESVVSAVNAIWYIIVYGTGAIGLLLATDWRLAMPMLAWFGAYAALLVGFVPRMRDRSRLNSEVRAMLTGRVVDSYANILTVKLFARASDEDQHVRDAIEEQTDAFRHQLRLTTSFAVVLALMNATMITATAAIAIWQWNVGRLPVGTIATALPLAWQIGNIAGWVAQNVTSIFENVGMVQDGMRSIAVPRQMADRLGASELVVSRGLIAIERVHFGYGTEIGVLHGVDFTVSAGERVGLVGASGAGKSTLVNLLLRFFDPDRGRILIDGQDIADVTQESLRGQIAMVTQDTSLLHRSIRDNIRYGRPSASEAEIISAAKRAAAHDFILSLEDWQGRRGYDAHVGERGVKLSGGQRQRIAIARVILKDAPILILDEATSALDSEVEAAIQEQLDHLMRGRTVIAIAHRLSTIAQMDRLIVLQKGRVVESGTHDALLAEGGVYAGLWRRQSGGFTNVSVGDATLGLEITASQIG
jgi:ATP-binding cassette subfamily B multidrug efflux pump